MSDVPAAIKPSVTPRQKIILATAINGTLAQCALLPNPRGYVTDSDAGIIISICALWAQVVEVEGTVTLTAKQTHGSSAQTAAAAAVETALAEVEEGIAA